MERKFDIFSRFICTAECPSRLCFTISRVRVFAQHESAAEAVNRQDTGVGLARPFVARISPIMRMDDVPCGPRGLWSRYSSHRYPAWPAIKRNAQPSLTNLLKTTHLRAAYNLPRRAPIWRKSVRPVTGRDQRSESLSGETAAVRPCFSVPLIPSCQRRDKGKQKFPLSLAGEAIVHRKGS